MVAGMHRRLRFFDLLALFFDLSMGKGVEQMRVAQTTMEPSQHKAFPSSIFLWKGCISKRLLFFLPIVQLFYKPVREPCGGGSS